MKLLKKTILFISDILFLAESKITPFNVKKVNESTNNIVRLMLEKEEVEEVVTESIDLPPSVLTKLAVNKFNSKYSDITESEKEIIKTVLNGSDEDKEEYI